MSWLKMSSKRFAFGVLAVAQIGLMAPNFALAKAAGPGSGGGGNYSASDFKEAGMSALKLLLANNVSSVKGIAVGDLAATCEKAQVKKAIAPLRDRNGRPTDLVNHPESGLIEYQEEALSNANIRQLRKLLLHECLGLMQIDESSYSFSLAITDAAEKLAEKDLNQLAAPLPKIDGWFSERDSMEKVWAFISRQYYCPKMDQCLIPSLQQIKVVKRELQVHRAFRVELMKTFMERVNDDFATWSEVRKVLRGEPRPLPPLPKFESLLANLHSKATAEGDALLARIDRVYPLLERLETELVKLGTQGGFQIVSSEASQFVPLFQALRSALGDFNPGFEGEQYVSVRYRLPKDAPTLYLPGDELRAALNEDLASFVNFGPSCQITKGETFWTHFAGILHVENGIDWRHREYGQSDVAEMRTRALVFPNFPEDVATLKKIILGTERVPRPMQVQCVTVDDRDDMRRVYDANTHTLTLFIFNRLYFSKTGASFLRKELSGL